MDMQDYKLRETVNKNDDMTKYEEFRKVSRIVVRIYVYCRTFR